MAFQAVPGGIELVMKGLQDNQRIITTMGFKASATPAPNADVIAVAQWAFAVFIPLYALSQTAQLHWELAVATALDTSTSFQYTQDLDTSGSVTASDPMPNSVAALVSFRNDARRGRGRVGRIFVPGLTEAAVDGDQLITYSDWDIVFQSVIDVPPEGCLWAVLSRVHHQADAVTTFRVHRQISSVDLRLPGRRRRRHVTP